MRRIVSLLMAAALVLSFSTITFAENEPELDLFENIVNTAEDVIAPEDDTNEAEVNIHEEALLTEGDGEGGGDEEEEDPNAYHVVPATKEGSLARIYLCSKTNIGLVGHIFIYVENLTEEPLQVGLITLEKDQGVSMGAFGFQRSDGWGVYYNTESFRYTEKDYSSIICISEELDAEHLAKLNNKLISYNYWELFINCVFFACAAWNSCTDRFVLPLTFPFTCRLQIRAHGATSFRQMYKPDRNNTYHMVSRGSKARLIVCSDKSLAIK